MDTRYRSQRKVSLFSLTLQDTNLIGADICQVVVAFPLHELLLLLVLGMFLLLLLPGGLCLLIDPVEKIVTEGKTN